LLPQFDLESFIYILIAMVIGITIHEASHALAAYRLGDPTAKALGRITLNPLAHLDPMGSILMVTTMLAGFGMGWGKPTPVNPSYLRPSPKTGMALVSAAGPLSNILTAYILYLPERLNLNLYNNDIVAGVVGTLISLSIGLACFNLIPLPPLDGFSIVLGLLPARQAYSFGRLAQYGLGPIFLLIIADSWFHWGILNAVLRPVMQVVASLVTGRPMF
jgi:Zn-dependent protease